MERGVPVRGWFVDLLLTHPPSSLCLYHPLYLNPTVLHKSFEDSAEDKYFSQTDTSLEHVHHELREGRDHR